MWTCPHCKAENWDQAVFCTACGRERGAVQPAAGKPRWLPWALLGLFGLVCIAVGLILLLLTPTPEPPAPVETPARELPGTVEIVTPSPAAAPVEILTPSPAAAYSGYLTESGQLGDPGLAQLKQTMEDTIAENIRSSWSPTEHLLSADYQGYLLLTARDEGDPIRNALVLVYYNRVNIRIPAEGVDKSLEYYYTLRFENVWCNADGSLILPAPVKPGNEIKANVPGHYFYYKGYPDLDELRKGQVDEARFHAAEIWD